MSPQAEVGEYSPRFRFWGNDSRMKRYVPRYLDPASRLGEILFGLIMALTFTLGAGLTVDEGRAGVRELLIAAIGCNLAWGIIDAVMYIMNCLTVRTGKMRLVEAIQRAPNTEAGVRLIQDEIEPELQELLGPEQSESLSRSILPHVARAPVAGKRLTKEDLHGAFACFWLVFVSPLPAAVPLSTPYSLARPMAPPSTTAGRRSRSSTRRWSQTRQGGWCK